MSTRNFVNLNVAVVGTGKVAERLAIILAFSDHEVFVGTKDEHYDAAVKQFRFHENITVTSIEDAAAQSEIVIIASAGNEVKEMAYFIDEVKTKVVIDYSCYAEGNHNTSFDTLNAIKTITGSKQVVKCYSTEGYKKFISPMLGKNKIEMFMVGDNKKSKVITKIVFDDLGFAECKDLGGVEAVNLLDAITMHEPSIPVAAAMEEKELVHVMR